VSWRTVALAACWIAAAGWGLYYLVTVGGSSPAFVANAVGHFISGYLLARAIMARPMTATTALLGTFAAGLYTRLAIAFGTTELVFAPLGLIAAIALADSSSPRNIASSVGAFAAGFVVLIWLTP
jgi:hypothetical protein